jgi:diguanylate cyclase (GGDEF)-like protein
MKANVELGRINCLYEETKSKLERQVNELRCLNRAVYQIRNDLDAHEIVKALLKAIRDELGFSRAMLFRTGGENNELYLADCITEQGASVDYEKLCSVPLEDNLLSSTLKQNRVTIFTKTAEWESEPLFMHLDTNKITMIPIVTKRGFAGVVTADNFQKDNPLSIGSIDLLNMLAHETGLAVDNAILFEKTKQLSIRDELTDLYNRRYCRQYMKSEVERAKRYKHPFSIVMFDVDHFKEFNDTYGHQAGDKILRTVALYLLTASRESDIIGRYGGEEFLVILPETPAKGAGEYAERVRLSIEEFGKSNAEGFGQTNLTISAGVASYDPSRNTLESFLELADQALYSAKRNGRNQVAVF